MMVKKTQSQFIIRKGSIVLGGKRVQPKIPLRYPPSLSLHFVVRFYERVETCDKSRCEINVAQARKANEATRIC
jgi:hypothetical protein